MAKQGSKAKSTEKAETSTAQASQATEAQKRAGTAQAQAVWAMKEGHHKEAEVAARAATDAQPRSAEMWFTLAWVLHESDRLFEADTAYRKVLALDANHERAQNNQKNLRRVMKPGNAAAHQAHAVRAIGRKQFKEAELAAQAAVDLQPENGEMLFTLGWVLHESKRFFEALTAYEAASKHAADNAALWFNMGNLLSQLKRSGDAMNAWQKASDLGHEKAARRVKREKAS
ncbi:MAG: tetratricopeptide repeat protein [Magnetococcales bacterium]|nr:tetratricopeptide repeat protein [Magnetococcales bacterium]